MRSTFLMCRLFGNHSRGRTVCRFLCLSRLLPRRIETIGEIWCDYCLKWNFFSEDNQQGEADT